MCMPDKILYNLRLRGIWMEKNFYKETKFSEFL